MMQITHKLKISVEAFVIIPFLLIICISAGCTTVEDVASDANPDIASLLAGGPVPVRLLIGDMNQSYKTDPPGSVGPSAEAWLGGVNIPEDVIKYFSEKKAFSSVRPYVAARPGDVLMVGRSLKATMSRPDQGGIITLTIATLGVSYLLGVSDWQYMTFDWNIELYRVGKSGNILSDSPLATLRVVSKVKFYSHLYNVGAAREMAKKAYAIQLEKLLAKILVQREAIVAAVQSEEPPRPTDLVKPVITILKSPPRSVTADVEKVIITFEVRSKAKLRSVRVNVNGKEIFRREGTAVEVPVGTPWESGNIEVSLAEGENKIEIMVEDVEGRIARPKPETITVRRG